MGESLSHIRLVDQMAAWIRINLLDGDQGCMMIDQPSSSATARPPQVGGFVPDIFVPSYRGRLIIAEAKTARDLERKHSLIQLEAFIARCNQVDDATFILAVPWHVVRLAESIIKQIQTNAASSGQRKANTKVLEKLSG